MIKRLAVLADIHAIMPVLDQALAEIEQLDVEGIIVAGDMLAGPNPVEVLQRLRALNCWMIRGNQENYILRYHHAEAPEWYYSTRQWAFTRWNYEQLDQPTLEFLSALPEQRSLHLPGTDPIRVVHGSPRNVSELIYPDKNMPLLDLVLSMVPEKVVIFGHTHHSWAVQRSQQLALNPGALSCNCSGHQQGGYAVLEWQNQGWQAELRTINYDVAAIRRSFEESGLLAVGGAFSVNWLRSIETGTNLLPEFIELAQQLTREAGYSALSYIPDIIWEQADSLFSADYEKRYPTLTPDNSVTPKRNLP